MATKSIRSRVDATDSKWNLGLSDAVKEDCATVVSDLLDKIRTVSSITQGIPQVKYPRDQGYRPPPEENIHNAWYYKTEIHGASSGKLVGKRVVVKDNVCVAGVPMMNGSKLMEGFVPEYDATVVTRILDAGATIAGKAACEDMGFSGNSFTCATGPVLNPNDVTRSSGGSSSGCGVLVRSGEVDMAVGSDHGGSVRIPSSWSGTVGMKPTFGLVPYTGAMGLMYSLDNLGPMTNNVRDCALLLEVMAGPDGMDERQDLSVTVPSYSEQLKAGVKGMKIGLVKEAFAISEPEVGSVVRKAVAKLQGDGASVTDVTVPSFDKGCPLFATLVLLGTYGTVFESADQNVLAGGLQDLAIFDHLKKHTHDRLNQLSYSNMVCTMVAEALECGERQRLLCEAQNAVLALREEYNKLLQTYDVLIMPTTLMVAAKLPTEKTSAQEQMGQVFMMTRCTEQFNMTRHPALTMPAGEIDGLPVGMMIVGKFYDEQTLLNVAYTYEGLQDAKPTNGTK